MKLEMLFAVVVGLAFKLAEPLIDPIAVRAITGATAMTIALMALWFLAVNLNHLTRPARAALTILPIGGIWIFVAAIENWLTPSVYLLLLIGQMGAWLTIAPRVERLDATP